MHAIVPSRNSESDGRRPSFEAHRQAAALAQRNVYVRLSVHSWIACSLRLFLVGSRLSWSRLAGFVRYPHHGRSHLLPSWLETRLQKVRHSRLSKLRAVADTSECSITRLVDNLILYIVTRGSLTA